MKRKHLFKSVLSLVLVCTLLSTIFLDTAKIKSVESAVPYTDVKESDWFYENVRFVTENGIMNCVAERCFSPEGKLSRAMSVTILYRLAGEPEADYSHSFADVKSGEWYSDAVAWAAENRITTGKSNTSFAPLDDVSRAEFATVLYRYAEISKLGFPEKREGTVADTKSVPYYATSAVNIMYRSEIINGRAGNVFDPHSPITRSEAAAIINRFSTVATEYTVVAVVGNSINRLSNTATHFKVIAGNRPIKVMDFSAMGFSLSRHCDWFYQDDEDREDAQRCDVYILQEGAGSFPQIGDNDEIRNLLYDGSVIQNGLPNGFCSGHNYVCELKKILGENKEYYAFTASDFIGNFDGTYTEDLLEIKRIFKEDYNVPLTYVSEISSFNKDLGLSIGDTYPDGLHPTNLMGYCIALTVYCDMYDVSPTEQNNGNLKPDDIPGETQAEKDAFMVELKKTVQDILDVQNIE